MVKGVRKMKPSRTIALRSGICAAALIVMSLPGSAFAQTSGGAQPPGVAPVQLPKTGGEPASADATAAIAAMALAGGALLAGLELRRRARREPDRRRR
jgi:hypothetical protein